MVAMVCSLGCRFFLGIFLLSLLCVCKASGEPRAGEGNNKGEAAIYTKLRKQMVQHQIVRRGVRNPSVLAAMLAVPRHRFVLPEFRSRAYNDSPLPIGEGQTISQPYIVAYMTEAINPSEYDRVLEVGTGSGYQAAVLAEIVGQVYTLEVICSLADNARKVLAELGYENIEAKCGDGYRGWPEKAPFDAIVVTAAPEEIPLALKEQLKVGGRMIIPVGRLDLYQELTLVTRTGKTSWQEERLLPVRFVPMVNGEQKGN